MYYYKTTLRLAGQTTNEVQKIVSAPEFLILGFIHGHDAHTKVEEIKNETVNISAEKDRLKALYEKALNRKKQSMDGIFGALGNLPSKLPQQFLEQYNIDGDGIIEVNPNEVREIASKVVKSSTEKKSVKTQKEIENETSFVDPEEVNVADLLG